MELKEGHKRDTTRLRSCRQNCFLEVGSVGPSPLPGTSSLTPSHPLPLLLGILRCILPASLLQQPLHECTVPSHLLPSMLGGPSRQNQSAIHKVSVTCTPPHLVSEALHNISKNQSNITRSHERGGGIRFIQLCCSHIPDDEVPYVNTRPAIQLPESACAGALLNIHIEGLPLPSCVPGHPVHILPLP